MAKNKKSIIPHYELLYMISNQYTEDEVKPMVKKVKKIIEDAEGKITYSEEWGKKKLAYPINHFNHAYYFLEEFDLEGNSMAKLNNTLKLSSEVMRYQIVRRPFRSVEEIKVEKAKQQEKAQQKLEEKKAEIKEEKLTSQTIKKEEAKKKVDLKDLDEKLDKILDTDDLL